MADELDALRRDLRDVDRAILGLVAKRLRIAQRIGRAKARQGLPTRNYQVEAEVLRDARAHCRQLGIDPALGDDLTRILIRAAVEAQEVGR